MMNIIMKNIKNKTNKFRNFIIIYIYILLYKNLYLNKAIKFIFFLFIIKSKKEIKFLKIIYNY